MPLMVFKRVYSLAELTYAEHVKELKQNQVLGKQNAVRVEELASKPYAKAHLWSSKYVETAMELEIL